MARRGHLYSKDVAGRQTSRVEVDALAGRGEVFVETFSYDNETGVGNGIAVLTPRDARRLARALRKAARKLERRAYA